MKISNVVRFTHENCEQYGSRITTKSFKDGVRRERKRKRDAGEEKRCHLFRRHSTWTFNEQQEFTSLARRVPNDDRAGFFFF